MVIFSYTFKVVRGLFKIVEEGVHTVCYKDKIWDPLLFFSFYKKNNNLLSVDRFVSGMFK